MKQLNIDLKRRFLHFSRCREEIAIRYHYYRALKQVQISIFLQYREKHKKHLLHSMLICLFFSGVSFVYFFISYFTSLSRIEKVFIYY